MVQEHLLVQEIWVHGQNFKGDAVKVPRYEEKVGLDVPSVPMPKIPIPPEISFGGAQARGLQDLGETLGKIAGQVSTRIKERQEIEENQRVADAYHGYSLATNDNLFNDEEEKIEINGQEIVRPKGVLLRKGKYAEGSLEDFRMMNAPAYELALSQVTRPESQTKLKSMMDNHYVSAQETVVKHASQEWQLDQKDSLENVIQQEISNFAGYQDIKAIKRGFDNLAHHQSSLSMFEGESNDTRKIKSRKLFADAVEQSAYASLQYDITGEKARTLLNSAKDSIDIKDYNNIKSNIVKESKNLLEASKEKAKLTQFANFVGVAKAYADGKDISLKNIQTMVNNGDLSSEDGEAIIMAKTVKVKRGSNDKAVISLAEGIFDETDKEKQEQAIVNILKGDLDDNDKSIFIKAAIDYAEDHPSKEFFKSLRTAAGNMALNESQMFKDYIKNLNAGIKPGEASQLAMDMELQRQSIDNKKEKDLVAYINKNFVAEPVISEDDEKVPARIDIDEKNVGKGIYQYLLKSGVESPDAAKMSDKIMSDAKGNKELSFPHALILSIDKNIPDLKNKDDEMKDMVAFVEEMVEVNQEEKKPSLSSSFIEGFKTYLKEGQHGMKLFFIRPDVALGFSKDITPEQFAQTEKPWVDILKDAYPSIGEYPTDENMFFKGEKAKYATQFTKEFLSGLANDLLEFGTRPSSWMAMYGIQQLLPKATLAVFKKLPKGWQEILLKERHFWGQAPIDKAYRELGLKKGASMDEVRKAWRSAALNTHPDRAPEGQAVKYTKEFIKKRSAYERILEENRVNTKISDIKSSKPSGPVTPKTPMPRGDDLTGGQPAVLPPKPLVTGPAEVLPKEVTNLNTEDLEKLIDKRYEAGATQQELDLLETEFDKRVSEEIVEMTEAEPDMAEGDIAGSDLTEALIQTYHQYITPKDRTGGLDDASFKEKGFWVNIVKEMSNVSPKEGITDEQVMDAAKDLYEHKVKLLERQRSKPTPGAEAENIKKISDEIVAKNETKQEVGKGKGNKPAEVQPVWTEQDKADGLALESLVSNWKAGGPLIAGNVKGTKIRSHSTFLLSNIGLRHKHMDPALRNLREGKPMTPKQIDTVKMLLKFYRRIDNGQANTTGLSESETTDIIREADKDEKISESDKIWWDEEESDVGLLGPTEGKGVSGTALGGQPANPIVWENKIEVKQGKLMPNLKPVEFPELVQIAKDVIDLNLQVVKKTGDALGRFYGTKDPKIKLISELFKRGNEQHLAITFAHEFGHLTDWMPDQTLKRGNIIGRLLTLKNFLNDTYGELSNKDLKNELMKVTQYLHPFDEKNSPKSYVSYRKSSRELYAEAISILLNSPGKMEELAPKFMKSFFENLDKKPEVKQAFFDMYDLLNKPSKDVLQKRHENIREMLVKGDELIKQKMAEKKLREISTVDLMRQWFDDANYPLIKKVDATEAKGTKISNDENPKYALEELLMSRNDTILMLHDIDADVLLPVVKAGLARIDVGEYMYLNRVKGKEADPKILEYIEMSKDFDDVEKAKLKELAEGYTDRKDLANPLGFSPADAEKQLKFMEEKLGPEKFRIVKEAGDKIIEKMYQLAEQAVSVGAYSSDVFNKVIKPNKGYYSTFAVLNYLQDYIPASIKAQKGTLKEIADPFIASTMKMASMQYLINRQKAVNSVISFLKEYYPGEITSSKEINIKGVRIFKDSPGFERIEVLENGKLESYDVAPEIAKGINNDSLRITELSIKLNKILQNRIFKPLYTTFNLGFAYWSNPQRDFQRFYKNMNALGNKVSVFEVLKTYLKDVPDAINLVKGELTPLTRSMLESKALGTLFLDFDAKAQDNILEDIIKKYGGEKDIHWLERKGFGALKQLLDAVKFGGSVIETLPKVAGYDLLVNKFKEDPIVAAYNTRNYIGTPNFMKKGLGTPISNEILLYSNIKKEAYKTDLGLATGKKTRSGYWWSALKLNILPKLLMVLASAGLFGKKIKDDYDKQTEYDKTNYTTIPLGSFGNKVAYFRLPQDETGRMISAVFYKLSMSLLKKDLQSFREVFALFAGEIPNVAPTINIANTWKDFILHGNAYDSFRGRYLIDETTATAGGFPALEKMVYWTINQTGQISIATYDPKDKTTTEKIVQTAPLINRMIRITDYGIQEKLNEKRKELKKETAGITLLKREVFEKYRDEYEGGEDIDSIVDSMKQEVYKGQDITQAKETALKKGFLKSYLKMESDDPYIDQLMTSSTNKEKIYILREMRQERSSSEMEKVYELLTDLGLISDDVVDQSLENE